MIFLLFTITTFSQVNVSISNMTYINGTPIANCGTIDFDSNLTVRVQFTINLTKASSQVVGVSNLYIYSVGSSGTRIQRKNEIVQPLSFDTSYSTSGDITMSESDFNATGGTLFAVFKSSSGVEYKTSCDYSVIKKPTPTFTLYPSTISLACNDVSERTFTVMSTNVPNGASVTYQWSYSGWSGTVSSFMNSINLTPSSGTALPSNVSVIPYVNGVAYPQKTCIITRPSIVSNGSISGPVAVCSSGTYTFNGVLAGQSVTWSLSNATAGTLSTTTGTSTTFTTTGGGAVDIIATASDACGQSYTKSLTLFAGSPPAFTLVRASNESCDDIKYHYVPFEIPFRNPSGTYTINVFSIPGVTVTQTTWTYNGVVQNVLVFPKTFSGLVEFTVSASNSCGNYSVFAEEEINSCSGVGFNALNANVEQFTVYPNPASDIVTIGLTDSESQSVDKKYGLGELFDLKGNSKLKIPITDNKTTFSVKGLKKDIYILKISKNNQQESHQIVVQ